MTAFDWGLVAIVLLSALMATAEGFFFEIFFLAGSVLGYLIAAWEYTRVAPWFSQFVSAQWVANTAGFLTVFFAVILLAGMAGRMARWIFKEAGLQWFDRALGAAFGLARGIVIATVLVMSLVAFSPGVAMVSQSRLGHYFLVFGYGVSWLAPAELRGRLKEGIGKVNALVLEEESHRSREKAPAH
ncbi:MAG TPA: CvpA family protein [Terriglobales bacterium]|jgi:membrane protein required for colicin V production|nr:CvpA family protein [Terriglobales bacterium]